MSLNGKVTIKEPDIINNSTLVNGLLIIQIIFMIIVLLGGAYFNGCVETLKEKVGLLEDKDIESIRLRDNFFHKLIIQEKEVKNGR